ncbi:DUF4126 family protein [Hymenobacter lutimineralis]|uniref:DUF4126 family protein n=1 Tax=Hymenobacter lutimineralis TaxID=2606448 RepID=A0A5D6V0I4_9BACT|nr:MULTISPECIES: DUF4126 family protein [Hymenobacter]QIX61367.1 DUF4126 family protein [Hymenobacter sp. BT18]TYZ08930.1 DUF4126 family protein [Hymenobacter lutimineralis]
MAASSAFWKTIGMGVIAGMRSASAPALLNHALQRRPSAGLRHSRLHWLQEAAVGKGLKLLAGAEMLGDKLPNAPDRTAPISVTGRAMSGALVGASLYKLNRQSWLGGAVLGAVGAVAGTFGAYTLRKLAADPTRFPEPLPGFVEDLLVVAGGGQLLANYRPRR